MLNESFVSERASGASMLDPSAPAAEGVRALDQQVANLWNAAAAHIPALALLLAGNPLQVVPGVALDRSEFGSAFHFSTVADRRGEAVALPLGVGAASTLPSRTATMRRSSAAHVRSQAAIPDQGRVPTRLLAALSSPRSLNEVNAQPPAAMFDELGL
jgi:hypothetical protein